MCFTKLFYLVGSMLLIAMNVLAIIFDFHNCLNLLFFFNLSNLFIVSFNATYY